MKSQTSISTTIYNKAYLARAWQSRGELKDYERRGFAQFFYFTICGHLEATLATHLTSRIRAAEMFIKWDAFAPMNFVESGNPKQCSLSPVTNSIKNILSLLQNEMKGAPIEKLTELYSKIFSRTLSTTIGPELTKDLTALKSIRNLFAHGRDFFLEFKDNTSPLTFPLEVTLDSHPLQYAAARLYEVSIIKSLNIDAINHDEFRSAFYDDAALLYFYKAVNEIEKQLVAARDFEPENAFSWIPPLPVLE